MWLQGVTPEQRLGFGKGVFMQLPGGGPSKGPEVSGGLACLKTSREARVGGTKPARRRQRRPKGLGFYTEK